MAREPERVADESAEIRDLALLERRLEPRRVDESTGGQRGVYELEEDPRDRHRAAQKREYRRASGSVAEGSHRNSSSSARTSYVSGSTEILGSACLSFMSRLPRPRQFFTGTSLFPSRRVSSRPSTAARFETKARLVAPTALPIAPNMGRMETGCGVGIDAPGSPSAPRR